MDVSPAGSGQTHILRNRHFVALWIGQMISAVGDYFYWLAMMLTVRKLTGSNAEMSASMISLALPSLFLGPIAGVMVDRWNRRTIMILSDVARAMIVLLCLLVHSREMVWIFLVVGLLQSTFSQFFFPARGAAVPLLVPESQLLAANGLMQMTMIASLIVGAGSAGWVIDTFGPDKAFLINSLGFLISAAAVATISVPHAPPSGESRGAGAVWKELREGLAFLASSRPLIGLIVSLAVLQLGMGALQVIFVPFLQDVFHARPRSIGLVDGSMGAGMAVGALAITAIAARCRQVWLGGGGLILIGLFIVQLGMAPTFGWVMFAIFLIGLVNPAINASLTTIQQRIVPDRKRGRVGGATNSVVNLASILSMGVAGVGSQMVNLRYVFYFGGALAVAAGLLTLVLVEEPPAAPGEEREEQDSEKPLIDLVEPSGADEHTEGSVPPHPEHEVEVRR